MSSLQVNAKSKTAAKPNSHATSFPALGVGAPTLALTASTSAVQVLECWLISPFEHGRLEVQLTAHSPCCAVRQRPRSENAFHAPIRSRRAPLCARRFLYALDR